MQHYKKSRPPFTAILVVIAVIVALAWYFELSSHATKKTEPNTVEASPSSSSPTVELAESQLSAIKIESVGTYRFPVEKKAVGNIAYHEQDITPNALPWIAKSTKFVVANVSESDSPFIHVGQPVQAKVAVYPDRIFDGKVSALGVTIYDSGGNPAIDPNTHRIAVRCEITDPKNELYPGMLANIMIQVQGPVESIAVPQNAVVRKGDGTMTAWVTKDHKRFEERTVKVGLQQDGYDQILEGLQQGEQVVTDGAIFVSNILYAPPSD